MLSYPEALKIILECARPLKPKALPLSECLGKILEKNIYSPAPFPAFNNSAVDGYAVCLDKRPEQTGFILKVRGEIPAGKYFSGTLKPGQAMQIFTGAPVPKGADAVVMQEYVERRNGSVMFSRKPSADENVRFLGEDFLQGAVLLKRKVNLGPEHLALLAATGHRKVRVCPSPRVAILTTGSELLGPGSKPRPGKIYDSNSILLETLVKKTGGIPFGMGTAGDTLKKIEAKIREGLKQDVLIISGGVSVGKYDYVKEALKKQGVKEIFWKVNIKPGKPLYFGKKGKTFVFGLPGNPVSVFVTFEAFVKPALLKMMGKKSEPMRSEGFLTKTFQNGPRLHFVRVRCQKRNGRFEVTPLKGQGSHQIGTLAKANGILKVDANGTLAAGQKVSVSSMSGDFL